jgi:hypothetical protein
MCQIGLPMDFNKTPRFAIVFGVAIASVLGLSLLALTGYGGSGSATTSEANAIDYDSYLDPCYTCTPTEDDFENLTTFELLAKYPQLSGDPIDNATETASDDNDNMPAAPEQNTTSFNETLTASNETSIFNGSASTNNTNSTR